MTDGADDFTADPHHDPSAAWAAGDDRAWGADGAQELRRRDPDCIYCEHGPYCPTCPPPPVVDGEVCAPCREAITRSEIAADPYYRDGCATGEGA